MNNDHTETASATLVRSDLVRAVAQGQTLSAKVVEGVLEQLFTEIEKALVAKRRVEIRNFGTFKSSLRKARKGFNPATGQAIEIPQHNAIRFLPAGRLKAEVKGV